MARKKKKLKIDPMRLLFAAMALIGVLLLVESVGVIFIVSSIAAALQGFGAVPSGLGIMYVYGVVKVFIGIVVLLSGVWGFYKETK